MSNTWKIYMLAFITFFLATSQFVIAGILDKVAASVGVSIPTAGQLITIYTLAMSLGPPVVIMTTARMDQRRRLLLALTIVLLGIVSTIALPGFAFLMVSRAILGLGTGLFAVTAYSVATKLATPGTQARAISNILIGFSAAMVLGVPIGRVVAGAYDWKVIFWGIGIFALLGIFAVAKTIPPTSGEAAVPIGQQFALLKRPKIVVVLIASFFNFVGYSAVTTYITPFLTSVVRINGGEVSVVLFALGIGSIMGTKLGGFLADRVGTTRTLFGGMVIQVIALVLLSISAHSTIMVILLLMVWMIATWTYTPPQNSNLVSLVPESPDIILSMNGSFLELGQSAGAAIGGAVVGWSMLSICWIAAAAVAMSCVFVGITHAFSKRPSDIFFRGSVG